MAEPMFRCASIFLLLALAACGQDEFILPGERENVRPDDPSILPITQGEDAVPLPPLALPAPERNRTWTHVNRNQQHLTGHLALSAAPSRIWSADIGAGSGKRSRITAGPVITEDMIYTMDAGATVTALTRSGRVVWQRGLVPEGEGGADTFGGGVAYDQGALVAATGYAELVRLDPASGEILWRSALEGAVRAAPSIADGRVVVVSRGDIAYGADAETGELDWRVQGAGIGAGLVGGSSPAIRGPIAIIPYGSGELTTVLMRSGLTVWNAAVTGGRRALVRGQIDDISGDPVIDIDIVYAANQGGRLVAFDRRSGERLWTHRNGAYGPVVPLGGSLFMVSDAAQVLRLDAETGAILWAQDLPEWQRPAKRKNAIPHFGPLVAGGNLIVASGDGLIRLYDPETGAPRGQIDLPGGAAAQPAIADGVLYVVSDTGTLHAFQ